MRFEEYVFGYKILTVREEDRPGVLSALLKRNLSAKMDFSGEIYVSLLKLKRYKKALSSFKYEISDTMGLPSAILKYRYRYGVICGIMLSIIYILTAFSLVWDIRIEDGESIYDTCVETELEENGFAVGKIWRTFSLSKLESDILEKSNKIGWININRRGTVAYVSIREKSANDSVEKDKNIFSNIVASRDCVIEAITVKSGIACVRAGDTVKKGELLISGVVPSEFGGGFVRAEGEIIGAFSEKIEYTMPKEEAKKTYAKEQTNEISLKILNFSVKLFKKYGKNDRECVIIEDTKNFVLLGKYRIPFGIRKVYIQDIEEETVIYSEKEMVEIANARFDTIKKYRFSDSEILKLKTEGALTEDSYTLKTQATVLRNIGEERVFREE